MLKRRHGLLLSVAIQAVLASGVLAQGRPQAPKLFAVGATAGTLGLGAEASHLFHHSFVLRGNFSVLDFKLNEFLASVGAGTDNDYDFETSGASAGLLIDWHPFMGGWRLTGGVRYFDLEFNSSDSDGATIGGVGYSAGDVGTVRTSVRNKNAVAPYFGFGYDATHFNRDGSSISLSADFGALYAGDPSVDISTTLGAGDPGIAASIATEIETLEDDIARLYHFYPVVMLTAKVSF